MSRVFLVTGYPRSRTSWLAMFLSSGPTLCLHEPIMMFDQQFTRMVEYVAALPHANIGIADSAIPAQRSLYALVYREAPVLVVERDKAQALASLKTFYRRNDGLPEKAFDEAETGLHALPDHFRTVKRISFESLGTVEGARDAWEFCCPGQPFDEPRYRAMDRIVCNPKI